MKKLLLLCLLLGVSIGAFAQVDTLSPITPPLRRSPFVRDMERITSSRAYRITYIGVPLIVAGLVVQERDRGFRHLRNDYVPSFRLHYDDYLQYAPAALMLGLKIGGVRGRSSWGRMLVSDAFSVALMAGAVNSLKYTCRMPRPDGSNNKSFPSGHTATAFMAATMLHKEYGPRSPWYSIAGYSMATVTGVSRMLNNKHWFSDVLVGAGIGILGVSVRRFDLQGQGLDGIRAGFFLRPLLPTFVLRYGGKYGGGDGAVPPCFGGRGRIQCRREPGNRGSLVYESLCRVRRTYGRIECAGYTEYRRIDGPSGQLVRKCRGLFFISDYRALADRWQGFGRISVL